MSANRANARAGIARQILREVIGGLFGIGFSSQTLRRLDRCGYGLRAWLRTPHFRLQGTE